MPRGAEELGGRRRLDDVPGIHDADPVGDLREQAEIVRDVEHGGAEPRAEIDEERDDLLLRGDVEARRRLVEDDEVGIAGRRHGDADALLLAAGKLVRIARQEFLRLRQADEVEELRGPLQRLALAACALVQEQRLGDLTSDADAGVERGRRVLRHEADAVAAQAVEIAAPELEQVDVAEENGAAFRPHARMAIAEELQADGGLSASGLADQPEDLAAARS